VLKPDGIFYSTTLGENTLNKLQDIHGTGKYIFQYSKDYSFTMENGEEMLKLHF